MLSAVINGPTEHEIKLNYACAYGLCETNCIGHDLLLPGNPS